MDLLTVDEIARLLKVNPVTVRRFISTGRLPAVRVGRRIRVHRKDAEALLAPIARRANGGNAEPSTPALPPPEDLARRVALFQLILSRRQQRSIAPLTSVELIHMARAQEEHKYASP
jgi:excisionase family DNA binding protein